MGTTVYSPLNLSLSLSLSHRRGSASATEPPGCSSPPSLSLLDTASTGTALLLLLAPERLRFGTWPDELFFASYMHKALLKTLPRALRPRRCSMSLHSTSEEASS